MKFMEHLKRVYCKAVDPTVNKVEAEKNNDYSIQEVEEPSWNKPENLIVSKLSNGKHSILLDIDIPVELIESSTPGHYHIGFPSLEVDWNNYKQLLRALRNCEIIEPGYCGASIERGFTAVRTPDNKKPGADEPIGFIQAYDDSGNIVDKPIYAPKQTIKPHDGSISHKYDLIPNHLGIAAQAACEGELRLIPQAGGMVTVKTITEKHFIDFKDQYRIPSQHIPTHVPATWEAFMKYGPGGKAERYHPQAYQWYVQHNISGADYIDFMREQYLYRVPNKEKVTFYDINI